ncbi:MAG: flavin reductase family protein [Streptosporangiales bacterium]|nr:flavin reductase family protein [Streptosporangiales bacterium]MBO0889304.1 flavin reductase family protein [Acidothermales bacterium]
MTELGGDNFRTSMSLLATGVTVVTTTTHEGPVGMTASAVCSLSLEPPQLLVCVQQALPTHVALEQSAAFGISVLGEEHVGVARRFATRGADRFAGLTMRDDIGAPILADAIAFFECRVEERHPGGDHTIFVGRVLRCGHQPGRRPLLYFDRAFGSIESAEYRLFRAWSEAGQIS